MALKEKRVDLSDAARADANGVPSLRLDLRAMQPSVEIGEYGSNLRDWLGDDEPDEGDDAASWVVQSIVAAGAPGAIVGPPKSMKTFIAEDLALHVALGRTWLGKFPSRQGRVLVLPREDRTNETKRRIWRLARGMGIDPRELADVLRIETARPFYFDDAGDLDAMRRTLASWRPSLLILDSLARCHRGEENSSTEMRQVTATWADLATAFDTSVVIVHHLRKPPAAGDDTQSVGMRMRGTSDLFAVVRHLLAVEPAREKGTSVLKTDGNLPGQPDPFAVALVDDVDDRGRKVLRLEYRGPAADVELARVDEKILQAIAGGPIGIVDLRRAVGKRNDVVDARCAALARQGRIVRDGRGPWRLVGRDAPMPGTAPTGAGTSSTAGFPQSNTSDAQMPASAPSASGNFSTAEIQRSSAPMPPMPRDVRASERAEMPRPIGGASGTGDDDEDPPLFPDESPPPIPRARAERRGAP